MGWLRLSLLGGIEARLESGAAVHLPGRKAQALLAYLALHPTEPHPRDKLAALLWGAVPEERARHSLRQALVALRRVLTQGEPPGLVEESETVSVNPDAVEVDALVFERLAGTGDPGALEQAAALYRGDLLAALPVIHAPFEEWLLAERGRLRGLARDSMASLLAGYLRAADAERAIAAARALLRVDPCRESVHRTLMRLHAQQGGPAAALRQYQACVSALRREVGAEPETETREVCRQILRSSGTATARPPVQAPGPQDLAARDTPFAGRRAELASLVEAWRNAAKGSGRVVAILGEAGIGKSRLAAELAGLAQAEGGRVLAGRAGESARNVAFGPWLEAFGRGGGVAHLEGGFEPALRRREELARLFPELGPRGGPPARDPEDPAPVFLAVADLVSALAAQDPLLVVLEDIDQADETSLRLLSFLGRHAARQRILLLVTARRQDVADGPVLHSVLAELERDRCLVTVPLSPLTLDETLALVRGLSRRGDDPAALGRCGAQIWAASLGNPLMVLETRRVLLETGAPITSAPGRLPPSVAELVGSRLDRLGSPASHVAAVAAVIGRDVDLALLERAARLSPARLAEAVEELVTRQIFHVVGERLDFTHDRVREVACARLLPPRARMLHADVAEAIEAAGAPPLGPDEDALATHHRAAEAWAKAVEHLARSGRRAARAAAHPEAVTALREALALARRLSPRDRDERLPDIVARLARSLSFLGRVQEARDVVASHEWLVERLGDPSLAARHRLLRARLASLGADREEAIAHARRAIAQAARAGDDVTTGRALSVLAMEAFRAGEFRRGIEHGVEAARLLDRTGAEGSLGRALWITGASHTLMGAFSTAAEPFERILALGRTTGDPRLESLATWSLGVVEAMGGDLDAAIAACGRALDLARETSTRILASGWLGYALLEQGDAPRAIEALARAVRPSPEAWLSPDWGWFSILLGEAYALGGHPEAAHEAILAGLTAAGEARSTVGTGLGERALGRLALAQSRLADAERHLQKALDTFGGIEAPYYQARTLLDLAAAGAAGGALDIARARLQEARRLFSGLRTGRWLKQTDALATTLGLEPA